MKVITKEIKNGRLITSHRSTTYSCCLPALGGFSRSWSCKTCRRKDKGAEGNLMFDVLGSTPEQRDQAFFSLIVS